MNLFLNAFLKNSEAKKLECHRKIVFQYNFKYDEEVLMWSNDNDNYDKNKYLIISNTVFIKKLFNKQMRIT